MGRKEEMEAATEAAKDSVVLNAPAEVAAGSEEGATGEVMLHLGGCVGSDHQAAWPMAPPQGEERATHVPDLHGSPSPVVEVVPTGLQQACSASPPEEDRRRGRPGFLGGAGGVLVPGQAAVVAPETPPEEEEEEDCGRERLKRHRVAMAGRVWIPESWGQEKLLQDWIDCSAIDRALVPSGLLSAREALVEECRLSNSGRFRIESRCLST